MSARERWRRITAYARASFRWALAFRAGTDCPALDQHQRHAWGRLPAEVRAQVARP